MKIPIANAIFENNFGSKNFIYSKKNILNKFENLKFLKVDKKRFPIVTLIQKFSSSNSGPIILNASNEVLVNKFIDITNVLWIKELDFRKEELERTEELDERSSQDNGIISLYNYIFKESLQVSKNKIAFLENLLSHLKIQ